MSTNFGRILRYLDPDPDPHFIEGLDPDPDPHFFMRIRNTAFWKHFFHFKVKGKVKFRDK